MGQEPEVIAQDIAATREDLSRNLDELSDKVSPSKVVGRQVDSVKGRLGSVKDTVMGSSDAATSTLSDAKDGVTDGVVSRAQGNPLAAGLIAFGAGLLVSSLLPASDAEAKAASRLVSTAKEHGQPLADEAKEAGQQVGQHLKEQAVEAAQDVKESAQDSASHVADEGRSAADSVRSSAT